MTLQAWRIVKEKQASTALDGEGAWRYGGRWNSPGTRVVYTSAALSLAALESLVHLNPPVIFRYVAIPIEFDAAWMESVGLSELPAGWTEEPPPPSTKRIGDLWVKEARSAVLDVPSVVVRSERNYLLNPAHPDFGRIKVGEAVPFAFDPRLL